MQVILSLEMPMEATPACCKIAEDQGRLILEQFAFRPEQVIVSSVLSQHTGSISGRVDGLPYAETVGALADSLRSAMHDEYGVKLDSEFGLVTRLNHVPTD